jgi:hypothetical protein
VFRAALEAVVLGDASRFGELFTDDVVFTSPHLTVESLAMVQRGLGSPEDSLSDVDLAESESTRAVADEVSCLFQNTGAERSARRHSATSPWPVAESRVSPFSHSRLPWQKSRMQPQGVGPVAARLVMSPEPPCPLWFANTEKTKRIDGPEAVRRLNDRH